MINSFQGAYRFLSNFYPAKINIHGIIWLTSEHVYQAAKTENKDEITAILNAATPGIAKRLGKNVTLRPNFDLNKLEIMKYIVNQKFIQNNNLMDMLKATGEQQIIEGNTWGDTYWGTCNDVGHNHLGKILMKIRELNK